MERLPQYKGKITHDMVQHELDRFFYDTAQVANAVTIEALAHLVPTTQIVFGSDFPYRTSAETVVGLDQRFKGKLQREIGRDNVARILPAVRKM